jgi:hypothetical protein
LSKIILLSIYDLLVFNFFTLGPPRDVILLSLADVVAFDVEYHDCTKIVGNLEIFNSFYAHKESDTQNISGLKVGCYQLELLDGKNCSVYSDEICIEDLTNTNPDIEENGIKVFPNPGDKIVRIELDKEVNNPRITIFNSLGIPVQVIYNSFEIELKSLVAGNFILKIEDGSELIGYTKLIVQ